MFIFCYIVIFNIFIGRVLFCVSIVLYVFRVIIYSIFKIIWEVGDIGILFIDEEVYNYRG